MGSGFEGGVHTTPTAQHNVATLQSGMGWQRIPLHATIIYHMATVAIPSLK